MKISQNAAGALTALGAFALFAAHDVAVKTLGAHYAPFQIVFFGTLLSFPLTTLMLMGDPDPGTLRPVHPWWTAARTLAVVVTAVCAFHAFAVLPLAQVYALLFAAPLLITVMSIPILGERVGARRWGAVVAGLAGVLVVLRPGATDLTLGHAAGLAAACTSAFASVVVRKIGRDERPVVMLLYPMVANVAVMGAALPFVYRPMPGEHVALFAIVALLAFVATLLVISAYRRAEAGSVAPMQYSQILWAALFGALVFGERPDAMTLLGAAIVIGAGLVILTAERSGRSTHTPVLRHRTRLDTGTALRVGPILRRREGLGNPGRGGLGSGTGLDENALERPGPAR